MPFLYLHSPQWWSLPVSTNDYWRFPLEALWGIFLGHYKFPDALCFMKASEPMIKWLWICDALLYSRVALGTHEAVLGIQIWVKDDPKSSSSLQNSYKKIREWINSYVLLKWVWSRVENYKNDLFLEVYEVKIWLMTLSCPWTWVCSYVKWMTSAPGHLGASEPPQVEAGVSRAQVIDAVYREGS